MVGENFFEIGKGRPVPPKCVFDFLTDEDFPESAGDCFRLGSGAADLLRFADQFRINQPGFLNRFHTDDSNIHPYLVGGPGTYSHQPQVSAT